MFRAYLSRLLVTVCVGLQPDWPFRTILIFHDVHFPFLPIIHYYTLPKLNIFTGVPAKSCSCKRGKELEALKYLLPKGRYSLIYCFSYYTKSKFLKSCFKNLTYIPQILSLFSQFSCNSNTSTFFVRIRCYWTFFPPTSALFLLFTGSFILVQIRYLFSPSQKYFHLSSVWIPLSFPPPRFTCQSNCIENIEM